MVYGKDGRRPRVLVTGAARGTGRIIANAIALYDVELILADNDGSLLDQASRELNAHGMFCDTQSVASVEIFEAQFKDRFDSLHMLISAAGNDHRRILSTIRMTAAFLPLLRGTPGTKVVVNVATGEEHTAMTPFPYTCSPEATFRYSEYLQSTLKGTSISVATLAPQDNQSVETHQELIEPLVAKVVHGFVPPAIVRPCTSGAIPPSHANNGFRDAHVRRWPRPLGGAR